MSLKNSSLPAGTLTPHLVVAGASEAIAFYKKAFGALEEIRLAGADGKLVHAMLRINGAPVMLVDENPQWKTLGPKAQNGSAVTLHLQVTDADAVVNKAAAAGATVTMPVADMFWGDRYGLVQDPFGHNWSVGQHVRDVAPEDLAKEMKKQMGD